MKKVIDIGGHSKGWLPSYYKGWKHHVLDIDPVGKPDILCDARELYKMEKFKGKYDAAYCSHNLEHYYRHVAPTVVQGMAHVTKDDGFVVVRVPDIMFALRTMLLNGKELEQAAYKLDDGHEITYHDMLFGWTGMMEYSGTDFYSHKSAFTADVLGNMVANNGFPFTQVVQKQLTLELFAFGFKQEPTKEKMRDIELGHTE